MFQSNKVRGVAVAVLLGWQALAQQAKSPTVFEIMRAGKDAKWIKGEPSHFTGEYTTQPMDIREQNTRLSRVRCTPGARTNWHVHEGGQVLVIESGRGWVQRQGGPIEEVGPGDVIYTGPGEKHWHGAVPDSVLTHLAISYGATKWMEPVTDQQYKPAK